MKHLFLHTEEDSVSYEEILTIMVIRFMLFTLLLVPMVNVDKANLEKAQKDNYWQKLYTHLDVKEPSSETTLVAYENVIDLGTGNKIFLTESGDYVYIESIGDNNILIYEHNRVTGKYNSMYIQQFSNVITYKHGTLKMIREEGRWFSTDEQPTDFGDSKDSKEVMERYRNWNKQAKGLEP